MKWADENEPHRYKSPKQMPRKCLTKEEGEIKLPPPLSLNIVCLYMANSKGRVETMQSLSTDQARTPTATPKEAPRPRSCSYPLALFLSETGSPRTHYDVLHDDSQRNIPGQLTLPFPSCQHCIYSHRHFPALRSSPDGQRHGINTSIKISLQSATDVNRIKQLGHHTPHLDICSYLYYLC